MKRKMDEELNVEKLDAYIQYRQQLIDEHHQMKQQIQILENKVHNLQDFKSKYEELKQDVDIYKFLLHSIVTKLNFLCEKEIPNHNNDKPKIIIKSKK